MRAPWPSVLALALALASPARAAESAASAVHVVDDFESVEAWSPHPAEGVEMKLSGDVGAHGRALRIDFRFARGSGYAVARRAVSLDLPERYAFGFRVRGACGVNDLEFKLIDASGENVWWCNRRGFEFPTEWRALTTRRRQIQFAWGPAGGGDLRHVAAIEIAITAGSGGEGTVWLDDLELRDLPPPSEAAPVARASSSRPGHSAELVLDADSTSSWRSAAGDRLPWLAVDFGGSRELGGLVIDWADRRRPRWYAVEASEDGREWRALREVEGLKPRDHLYLPETETRLVRVRALEPPGAGGCAIATLEVKPPEWAKSLESFFEAVARDAPRGDYPRGIAGEQPYWTVVGREADREEALVSEDGAVEAGKQGFTVEPFLYADGRLWTWADVRISRGLVGDQIHPAPVVGWEADSLELRISIWPEGIADTGAVRCEYSLRNTGSRPRKATLHLAIRPFQVNPPAQFLNAPGGVSPIHEIAREGSAVRVNGDRGLLSLDPPSAFGASTFDQGDIVDALRAGTRPRRERVVDEFGFASGALAYEFVLAPAHGLKSPAGEGRAQEHDRDAVPVRAPGSVRLLVTLGAGRLESLSRMPPPPWRTSNALFPIVSLPASARAVTQTLDAQLGFILVNRDGPAIQPGSRSYERSWIRDGALTCSALLRMGRTREVREFIEWFAGYQYASGKVPCCVDRRGPDPVPEHDSHGEFIFLVAEYLRMTGESEFAAQMWPHVRAAATYLDSLRRERRTPEYRAPARREFYGLLPPSISHEGYSAKPMHSYWDDFFALRGFADAGYLAEALGRREEAARWKQVRDEFERDLRASIVAAMARHHVDYVPGCADLGDFDATSTTIALSPVQGEAAVPPDALRRTFERYWTFFRDRRDGRAEWEAFTPYEIRNIGAFVRLGWRERANELLDFFLAYRRPSGWPQWPEVVWRDERAPHFIGDLPHTWVGSDYVRSVLDMLAYERESDDALVIGAGVPAAWVREKWGVGVTDLHTRYGRVEMHMESRGNGIEVRIDRPSGLRMPRGGFVIAAPEVRAGWKATVNGAPVPVSARGEVIVRAVPATVLLMP